MAKKADDLIEVSFLKAPAHLRLAYHKGQEAKLPAELAEELISTGYAERKGKAAKQEPAKED
tara:strand:+ start:1906 stop:2091 length:186 start_codon:yes stop_codon:yes gene_type:complete